MQHVTRSLVTISALALCLASGVAEAKSYTCEFKKDGKVKDDDSVKTRKDCKKKGGQWVKADHGHRDHEEAPKDEPKVEAGKDEK